MTDEIDGHMAAADAALAHLAVAARAAANVRSDRAARQRERQAAELAAPLAPAHHGLFTTATTWPMTGPALGRARAVVEAALRREVAIASVPITSRAGYVEARAVMTTVRARIEGMRIMGALPPGPALSAALGVATVVTARIREWEAALDAKLVAAQRRVPAGERWPVLTDTMKRWRAATRRQH